MRKGTSSEVARWSRLDPGYFRPAEVETLLGDATKARAELGWQPKTSFHALVEEIVEEDLKSAEGDALVSNTAIAPTTCSNRNPDMAHGENQLANQPL